MNFESQPMGLKASEAGTIRCLNITQRLKTQRDALKSQLERTETAIKMLEHHPETQAILDILAELNVRF